MDSIRGSNCRATTVWAILSATLGIPRILVPPPCGFGISTALTAGGKYVPEDILTQILYRLFFRSASNSSMDCPSTPAAPFFSLTLLYAFHTRLFGMSNDLFFGSDLPTRVLPEMSWLFVRTKSQMSRSLRSTLVTSASSLLQTGPPARAATVLNASQFQLLRALPLANRPPQATDRNVGTRFPTFRVVAADQARAAFTPDTAWPISG